MKLERTLTQWAGVKPEAIATASPAAITYFAADAQKDIATLATELAVHKGKNASKTRLLAKIRNRLVQVTDHIEDEGDRCYFGSTNDADELRDLKDACEAWLIDAEVPHLRMTTDPYADIRAQRARAEKAEDKVTEQAVVLREAYTALAFAFNRIHASSRTRDGELAADLAKVRGRIEKVLGPALNGEAPALLAAE